jgi:hypothetical protein
MRLRRVVALGALVLAIGAIGTPATQTASGDPDGPKNEILARELAIFRGEIRPSKFPPVSGGVMTAVIERFEPVRAGAASPEAAGPSALIADRPPATVGTLGCPNIFLGDGVTPDNIRVNQDCSLRRQAEEVVVVNPQDPNNLIAGQNDSRIGFNHCGYDWTFDGGATWGDQVPPFWQFVQLDGHTSDACSDPTATFDSQGNAYIGGVIFDVVSVANSIVVAKSNAPIGGAFYHSPMSSAFQEYSNVPLGVVATDDNITIFNDKEFIVADDNATGSPKKDNVYTTWTRFTRTHSPIFFSQSDDGGATWSPGVEISGSNRSVCTFRVAGPCNDNQGSHPIVGPDGTIYVVFGNGNTPLPGINQVLFVKCLPTADCSQRASWTAPTRVGDLIGTHPIGDPGNEGGCPVGRECLPPNGYRVPEFTSMSISVDAASNLYIVWSDFRNGDDAGSTCGPLLSWSEAEPPCNNDVFYAFSTDRGATWSATRNITPPDSSFGQTAQWQPWSEVTVDGGVLVAAFYDRQYVDVDDVDERTCEFTGCNDITAALIADPTSDTPTMTYRRITTASMPNLVPANNPVQAGFLGDYMWVDTEEGTLDPEAHIVWADTRPLFGTAPEEDIYYARITIESG